MVKIPKCLSLYLQSTQEGDRNNNLFAAMKHIKQLNPKILQSQLQQTAQQLNKNLKRPLSEREVIALSTSVMRHEYKSSCYPFKPYCTPSNNCETKPYHRKNQKYLKMLDVENKIRQLKPAIEAYPWDFEDLSKLTAEQADIIREFRIDKGINPMMDNLLKLKHVKVGDEALKDWQKYCGVKVDGS
ncbi:MAG: primase C-terminal domain-containing protein [Methanobacterium sp.]